MPHTYIIAEAGVNHNGSLETALSMVEAAVYAGADAVKFQTFNPEALVSQTAPKADYQKKHTAEHESQLDMLRRLVLSEQAHQTLVSYCSQLGIDFLSSPFDAKSAGFLCHTLDLPRIKLGSGEITNGPLLLQIAQTGKHVILSTGMSALDDIETALGVLAFGYTQAGNTPPSLVAFQQAYASSPGQQALLGKVILLHCTTEYPCPYEDVNLKAMETMSHSFGLPVGFSDHTQGVAVSVAAVARGATIIEKHFTLSRQQAGPDHQASLEPDELKRLVTEIRAVEQALGEALKCPAPSELKNQAIARKSLVAARPIAKGELFTPQNLTAKRVGGGISPMRFWDLLGCIADRDYAIDEEIVL